MLAPRPELGIQVCLPEQAWRREIVDQESSAYGREQYLGLRHEEHFRGMGTFVLVALPADQEGARPVLRYRDEMVDFFPSLDVELVDEGCPPGGVAVTVRGACGLDGRI